MQLQVTADGFELRAGTACLLRHGMASPCVEVGRGEGIFRMYRGNFDVSDTVLSRTPLAHATVGDGWVELRDAVGGPLRLTLRIALDDSRAAISFTAADPGINRVWLRLPAEPGERVWGCGEQMSHLDLRGRRFPLWTSEPGVGRDKSTAITRRADAEGRAGGDYYTTNYPQPTFLTSRRVAVHMETAAYAVFDFTAPDHHLLEVWAVPDRLELTMAPSLLGLVEALSLRFGRQPPLPDWVMTGAILGLKDGAPQLRAAGSRHRRRRPRVRPVVRGLVRRPPNQLRPPAVLGLAVEPGTLPRPARAHRRPASPRHPLSRLREPLPVRRRPAVPGSRSRRAPGVAC